MLKCVNLASHIINSITFHEIIESTFIGLLNKALLMHTAEIEKSKSHILIEIIEYVPNSVVSKTIIRKTTGNVSVVAIDTGETMAEKISPFDTFIQVIEGIAEVVIDDVSSALKTGQAIIIPAHTSHIVRANVRFKMVATIIKSGYEEINL